mmetsp:Transcript_25153/g.58487  ORF Transcript_25153/g.58487 Transcript_25153/m.58487 type:complete len:458 (+) Transcript_25153:72-1445(+)
MFRRLGNRLSSALRINNDNENNNLNGSPQDGVVLLQSMGFTAEQSQNALLIHEGNVQAAADYLVSTQAPQQTSIPIHDDVMQDSLQSEEQRMLRMAQEASLQQQQQPPTPTPQPMIRSTASQRAGQAALERFSKQNTKKPTKSTKSYNKPAAPKATYSNPTTTPTPFVATTTTPYVAHHPQVKVPVKLQDKSLEEQVLRCADRLKSFPRAVDTLLRALKALQDNPQNTKFHTIDMSSKGFKNSVAEAPGAVMLLQALQYHAAPYNPNRLLLREYDAALIYLGISALESIQTTVEYKRGKQMLVFQKELDQIRVSADTSEAEAIGRANFLAKCPTEPAQGRGATVKVKLGNEMVERRFDGDDVLGDILHWLGGHGTAVYEKLVSRDWVLVDLNRSGGPGTGTVIPLQPNLDMTLRYIGCWPSGRLEVRPNEEETTPQQITDIGSSRGLGAAPAEALQG